jgi:hypothetical protein
MDGRTFIKESLAELNNPSTLAELEAKRPLVKVKKPQTEKKDEATANVSAQHQEKPADKTSFRIFNHYVMNLPATAIEFLGITFTILQLYR